MIKYLIISDRLFIVTVHRLAAAASRLSWLSSYGLRPLPPAPDQIALRLWVFGIWEIDLRLLVSKFVICHAWCLHFEVLGGIGTILGHWGAQKIKL